MNRMVSEHLCRTEGYNAGIEDGHSRGLSQGLSQGRKIADVEFVRKKLMKNKSIVDIAEMMETDQENVEEIVELLRRYPEESDLEIVERLNELALTNHVDI